MTGTDLCVRLYKSVPVIFEPLCIYQHVLREVILWPLYFLEGTGVTPHYRSRRNCPIFYLKFPKPNVTVTTAADIFRLLYSGQRGTAVFRKFRKYLSV